VILVPWTVNFMSGCGACVQATIGTDVLDWQGPPRGEA
jgi:hypothetical protein